MNQKRSIATSYKDCTVSISYTDYAKIVKGFMKFIMMKVFDGDTVELPARMGDLSIKGKKVTPRFDENGNIVNLAPDWVKTKQLWERDEESRINKTLVYHFNEHTGGVRYKICWNKGMSGAVNKLLYIFKPSRENKRKTWKSVTAGKEFYVKPKFHSNVNNNI
jgi:hypothetical protein